MQPSKSQPMLYQNLAARLARSLDAGAFRAGDRLPSVRQLARRESVSIATAVAAYRELEDRRLVEARPKRGYFVSPRRAVLPEPGASKRPATRSSAVGVNRLIMEILGAARDPSVVPLAAACPSGSLMVPAHLCSRAAATRLRRDPGLATSYRMGNGYEPLRRSIAQLAFAYGCLLEPDEIVVTNGCMEALTLALRALVRPGETVAIESPTYFSVLQILESLGARVLELPTNPRTGVSVEALELATRRPGAVRAMVLTPNFSNPLGSLMPDLAKRQVVSMMAERGIPIVEDDVYGELHFGDVRPRPMKSWDREGNVILCSSFTKILAPGLRVGWMAPGRFGEEIALLKFTTSVTTAEVAQATVAELLSSGGFLRHVRRLRSLFATQVRRVTESIERHFPAGCKVTRPSGGFVLWIELPRAVSAMDLFWKALEHGVSIAPGVMFSPSGGYAHHIRISCGNVHDENVERAIEILGKLAAGMAAGHGGSQTSGSISASASGR
ncbi:MAG: PLP-dependent aminotransferase family protein [Betaproteobacteria bacterium]|nr:PLP-dependent aminotransferase family protein [Betaproteobacteria bacterium]